MDLDATATLRASAARVFAEVADLGTYPEWLSVVHAAVSAPPDDADPGPAWAVDLGARLGPLRRTKRVRMVRTEHRPPKLVRFEREEHDGRTHSAWVLTADVEVDGDGSRLTLGLHYGGALRVPALEAVLREEVRRAGGRLQRRLDASGR